MTFAEAMEFVTKDKCVYRDWWQQDYGKPIIGLHRGTLMKFSFGKWSSYALSEIDIVSKDWQVVPDAPTFDEIIKKVDDLKERLIEKEEFICQEKVNELRKMLNLRHDEIKRSES